VSGDAGTGGGGGGANGYSANSRIAGTGGSGVVVIRYPAIFTRALSTTGANTYTVSDGYRYYRFTASGTITF
jgi:hypothetical protein